MNADRQIASRLSESLELLNKPLAEENQIDIAQIADEVFNYESAEKVEGYFDGTLAQPFEFLRGYSEAFGVSYEWLRSGKGGPFPMTRARSLDDYKNELEKTRPRAVYFVLNKSEKRRAVLMLKISEHCYKTLGNSDTPLALHSRDHKWAIGEGGKSGILDFYKLIRLVYGQLDMGVLEDVSDYEIENEAWDSLVSGEICPLSVFPHRSDGGTNWADDLQDLDHSWLHDGENYEQLHGEWFVETQRFIKGRLQKTVDE